MLGVTVACINIQSTLRGVFWSYFAQALREVGEGVFAASFRSWSKVKSTFSGFSCTGLRLGLCCGVFVGIVVFVIWKEPLVFMNILKADSYKSGFVVDINEGDFAIQESARSFNVMTLAFNINREMDFQPRHEDGLVGRLEQSNSACVNIAEAIFPIHTLKANLEIIGGGLANIFYVIGHAKSCVTVSTLLGVLVKPFLSVKHAIHDLRYSDIGSNFFF